MTTQSYRELIIRHVVACMKRKHYMSTFLGSGEPEVWASDIYHELFQKYPRYITFRMVMSVFRDSRVFKDVTEPNKRRFGRRYRLHTEMVDRDEESVVQLLLR